MESVGYARRYVARAKARRATEGKIIKSFPRSVKKLRSVPTGNGKP